MKFISSFVWLTALVVVLLQEISAKSLLPSSSSSSSHLRVPRGLQDDYVPFPDGTPVRWKFEDGWYFGELISYDPNEDLYKVSWSDNPSKIFNFHSHDDTAAKVAAAAENYEPHPVGTRVVRRANDDDSDPVFVWGTIDSYNADQRSYIIGFDDDEDEDQPDTYVDLSQIDTWVLQASKYTPYAPGTPIRHQFSDGWFFGVIDSYDEDEMTYIATWSDGTKRTYQDLGLVDDKVKAAGSHYENYSTGQKLLRDGQEGTIVAFDDDDVDYSVSFGGAFVTLTDLALVDDYVRAYQSTLDSPGEGDQVDAGAGDDASDYVPFPIGTLVRHFFDDGYLFGTITDYSNVERPSYVVQWSDGVINTYTDLDVLTGRVHNAGKNYEPFDVGTPVRELFADSEDWFFGEISSFDTETRTYRILWSDGIELANSNLVEMDELVRNAAASYLPYTDGTLVRDENEQKGAVADYNPESRTYTVRWDSGTDEVFTNLSLMDKMVNRVKDEEALPIGTKVRKFFDEEGKWKWGEIARYQESTDTYSVSWSDTTESRFVGPDGELETIVKNARTFEPYGRGTAVRKQFGENNWWFFGEVTSYDATQHSYSIVWSDDDTTSITDYTEMDEIVRNAEDGYDPYGDGTSVYHRRGGDGWFWGTITDYDPSEKIYTIQWSDGTQETEGDLEDIDEYVNNALKNSGEDVIANASGEDYSESSKPVGMGSIILNGVLFLTVVVLMSYILIQRRREKEIAIRQTATAGQVKFRDNLQPDDDVRVEDEIEAELPEVA